MDIDYRNGHHCIFWKSEIKEIRSLAAFGVIHIVKTSWLEECTLKKKEVPVFQGHIAYDTLLPKGSVVFNGAAAASIANTKEGESSASQLVTSDVISCESRWNIYHYKQSVCYRKRINIKERRKF